MILNLPQLCHRSTILPFSNILITIPCKNVQYVTLAYAHKPKFSSVFCPFCFRFFRFLILINFYSSYPFFGPKKFWRCHWKTLRRRPWPITGELAILSNDFWTKHRSCFSLISSVRMRPIFKINSSVERSIQATSDSYQEIALTC